MRKLNEEHEIRIHKLLEKQKKSMEEQHQKINKERDEKLEKESTKYKALVKAKLAQETAEKELKAFKEQEKTKKDKWILSRVWDAIWNK